MKKNKKKNKIVKKKAKIFRVKKKKSILKKNTVKKRVLLKKKKSKKLGLVKKSKFRKFSTAKKRKIRKFPTGKKSKLKKFSTNKNKKTKKVKKNSLKINKNFKIILLKTIRVSDKLKSTFKFNFSLDQALQNFFQGMSDKINNKIQSIKFIIDEEKERKKGLKIKQMQKEKADTIKKSKIEKQLALDTKKFEFKEEIKFEKERKKDLQKFIRLEQADVRKEQAEKQRKFLEQIKLEKKIEQFRKREALEIKNLEKFVLSQERESYESVQERIDKVKLKYQTLRDQKIKERIQELGIEVTDSDTRAELLEKERQYNLDRQKIEFALESYYRSMTSCVFQLNKRWIPKKMSLLRVLDYRYERSEIFIKFDEDEDSKWLMLVYIKDNNPEAGIIVEDKTNPEKNISVEYKNNEIFKFSDSLVDSLTNLLDRERKKLKSN